MARDMSDNVLKVGDKITLTCVIVAISGTADDAQLTLETEQVVPAFNEKSKFVATSRSVFLEPVEVATDQG